VGVAGLNDYGPDFIRVPPVDEQSRFFRIKHQLLDGGLECLVCLHNIDWRFLQRFSQRFETLCHGRLRKSVSALECFPEPFRCFLPRNFSFSLVSPDGGASGKGVIEEKQIPDKRKLNAMLVQLEADKTETDGRAWKFFAYVAIGGLIVIPAVIASILLIRWKRAPLDC
jgi:hypothetical protein